MSLQNYALEWIKPELMETLSTARQGLEAFAEAWEARGGRSSAAEAPDAGIERCVDALHQAHGSLIILEVDGMRRLAEHLERVAGALRDGVVQDVAEACQALMQGILELPGYLDDLLAGGADAVAPLLPLINELRRHLGEPPLEDGSLAGRLKSIASEAAIARFEAIDGVDKMRRVRAAYQQILLSVLKGADVRRAAETLRKVAEGMRRICEQTPFELQWLAFAEFVEGLALHVDEEPAGIDAAAVKLMRRLDSEIREFATSGSQALRRPISLGLLQQLVDGAAERGRVSPVLDALREALDATEKSHRLSVPGRQALASAATALREELSAAKDRLDLFMRSEARNPRELSDLVAPLKQVASTLSLLGFESAKTIILDQLEVLASLEEGGLVEEAAVHSVASALMQVDENLSSVTNGGHGEMERIVGDAQRAVAEQARIGLERVKQCLVDYVSSQWDVRHLPGVPEELAAIAGALEVIPLPHVPALLHRCRDFIACELMVGHVPTWEELDRLADAISGIDYYLERVASDSPGGADEVLALVERSLDGLIVRSAPESERFVDLETPPEPTEAIELTPEPAVAEAAAIDEPVTALPMSEFEPALPAAPLESTEPVPGTTVVTAIDATVETAAVATAAVAAPDEAPEEDALALEPDPAFDLSTALFDGIEAAVQPAAEPVDETDPVLASMPADLVAPVEFERVEALRVDEPVETAAAATIEAEVPALPAAITRPMLADEFDADADIVEIFIEEVGDVLAELGSLVDAWEHALGDVSVHADVRRGFHTLKGSGRLVGANVLGEMAWAVENMLNRVVDGTVVPTPEFVGVVREALQLIPALRDAFAQQLASSMDGVARVIERADMLSSGGSLADIGDRQVPEREPGVAGDATSAEVFDAASEEEAALFLDEARSYVELLGAAIRGDGFVLDESALRALHTLSGSAAMAGQPVIADLAGPAYELAQALRRAGQAELGGEEAGFFMEAVAALAGMVDAAEHRQPLDDAFQLIAEADRLLVTVAGAGAGAAPGDGDGGEPLLELPSLQTLMVVGQFLDSWRDGAMDLAFAEDLRGALADIWTVAEARGHAAVAELAGVLLDAHERYEFAELDDHAHGVLTQAHEQLLAHVDAIAADQAPYGVPDLQAALDDLAPRSEPADGLTGDSPGAEDGGPAEVLADVPASADQRWGIEVQEVLEPDRFESDRSPERDVEPDALSAAATGAVSLPEDVDEEILGLFFEEADELLELLEQNISDWAAAPTNLLPLENLLRALHTLKGGARLAGLSSLGDLTHDLESFLIEFQGGARPLPSNLFEQLEARHDALAAVLAGSKAFVESAGTVPAAGRAGAYAAGELQSAAGVPAIGPAGEAPPDWPAAAAAAAAAVDATDAAAEGDAESAVGADAGALARAFDNVTPLPTGNLAVPDARQSATVSRAPMRTGRAEGRTDQEMVRVSAGLLESLVNLAGESSIIRARVEQGMTDIAGSLEEMERTIQRLRDQLRRLDIEAEGQMLFRRERGEGTAHEAFDPLEMDRYSQLQQLSRSLSESASDLLDLKDTLLDKSREAETLLLQQARVNTELQEGLMRSRMVPFSRLLPRLRRTVRQVSRELDKNVELRAFNVEGELDRTLLERMLPPLEHMLRNAVDHGIEAPEQRRAMGKAQDGSIDLRLSREGGDLVIEISDDGAGIDVDRVRAKAIERGLLALDADLRDEDVSQFVLAPGFSTAKAITQISGRGVGMDVVHSEVKQLGGNIEIFTERGKGTRFLLRVPFTVSVNRALMVSVGEDLYAVPLNTIEGIVLVTPDELERLYGPGGHSFEYAGVPYRVQYLGSYLGRDYRPQRERGSVPVVLVRAGEHAVAVHVDGVQGSREIVVKSLGQQFAGVGGISGATILGDGSVVVILDLLALIRAQSGAGLAASARRPAPGTASARRVMVVDDSVTVRKVTSRLLERQGMDVQVAKDGVEAMALLLERRPDVLLLDIEMPRMDGFEVLRQVRHDDRLRDLPVVMISSRSGAKHQQHATDLGVNGFLGKPFQESELLSMIDKLMS